MNVANRSMRMLMLAILGISSLACDRSPQEDPSVSGSPTLSLEWDFDASDEETNFIYSILPELPAHPHGGIGAIMRLEEAEPRRYLLIVPEISQGDTIPGQANLHVIDEATRSISGPLQMGNFALAFVSQVIGVDLDEDGLLDVVFCRWSSSASQDPGVVAAAGFSGGVWSPLPVPDPTPLECPAGLIGGH